MRFLRRRCHSELNKARQEAAEPRLDPTGNRDGDLGTSAYGEGPGCQWIVRACGDQNLGVSSITISGFIAPGLEE